MPSPGMLMMFLLKEFVVRKVVICAKLDKLAKLLIVIGLIKASPVIRPVSVELAILMKGVGFAVARQLARQ